MKFDILNRHTGAVQFTAEIECGGDALRSFKLGLAVKAAVKAGANLRGADIRGADLRDADIRGANIRGADINGADLRGANLRGANLRGANLCDASLWGADLRDADIRGADHRDADIRGANIRGADISGADISGANLRGASLWGADQIAHIVTRVTRSDGYEFIGFKLAAGGIFIRAGCCSMTLAEYRAHIASKYPDTPKARETTDILDFIEKRAEARP